MNLEENNLVATTCDVLQCTDPIAHRELLPDARPLKSFGGFISLQAL